MSCSCKEGAEGRYLVALTDPFNGKASGAQVPDTYSFPTSTAQIKETFVFTPTSSEMDFVIQPSLFCTVARSAFSTCTGGYVNYSSITSRGSTGFTELGIISQAQIAKQFARYRIVGGGIKIKVLTPSLTTQGELFMCMVPSLSHAAWFPAESAAVTLANGTSAYADDGLATWTDYLGYYELPQVDAQGLISTQIQGMPLAHKNMLTGSMLEGGVEVAFKVASPDCLKFRDATPTTQLAQGFQAGVGNRWQVSDPPNGASTAVSFNQGGQLFTGNINLTGQSPALYPVVSLATSNAGLGGFNYIGYQNPANGAGTPVVWSNPMDEDFIQQGGWSVLVFRGSGLAFTTAAPTFSVEVCFHLEGTPPIPGGQTSLYGQVQTFNASYPPVNPHAMHAAHSIAGHLPVFKKPGKISAHIEAAGHALMSAFGGHQGHHHHHGHHNHHHGGLGNPLQVLKGIFGGHNHGMQNAQGALQLAESAAMFL